MGEALLVIVCAGVAIGWLVVFIRKLYEYDIQTLDQMPGEKKIVDRE